MDSSLLNSYGAVGSYGGSVMLFPGGGGSFSTSVSVPRKLTDSSGGAELVQSTLALKTVLGFQILARELRLHSRAPTPISMDANAVLIGTQREKVSKEMRFVSCRYAMLRSAIASGHVRMDKVATEDNIADICTKPLVGETFFRHRAAILGLTADAAPLKLDPRYRPKRTPSGGQERAPSEGACTEQDSSSPAP